MKVYNKIVKMSRSKVAACSCILRDYMDEKIEKVGTFLAENGSVTLRIISMKTGINMDETRSVLRFLIKNNIVTFHKDPANFIFYSINLTNVLAFVRHSQYICVTKSLFGCEAELIVREIVSKGQMKINDVISAAVEKLGDRSNGEKRVYDKFVQLVQTHFVRRCPSLVLPSEDDNLPNFKVIENQLYSVPAFANTTPVGKKRNRPPDDSDVEPTAKRRCTETSNTVDEAAVDSNEVVYWCINIDRFNEFLRDQAIISAVANRVDVKAAEVVRSILRLSEVKSLPNALKTVPISYHEIIKVLPQEMNFSKEMLDQWLKILTEVAGDFVRKEGDGGGGQYSVHFQNGFAELCKAHIESVVQERYGSKSKRILRVLLAKKQVEMSQIEALAMVDPKETKEIVYHLMEDSFISLTEVPRTSELNPAKTYFLFSVNINRVAQMLLELCYKTLSNLITRRMHEMKENKRLIDKQRRMEAILAQIDDPTQRSEFEEQMTPAEKAQVEKFNRTATMLQQSEQQLDETIFTLETHIAFSLMK